MNAIMRPVFRTYAVGAMILLAGLSGRYRAVGGLLGVGLLLWGTLAVGLSVARATGPFPCEHGR